MKIRSKWLVVSASILGLAGAATLVARKHSVEPPAATAPAAVGFRAVWPIATELRYRFDWETQSEVHVETGPDVGGAIVSGGASKLAGVLVVRPVRVDGAKTTLLVSFADLEEVRFVVDDGGEPKTVPPELARAAMIGPTATVELDDRGRVGTVRVPKDANAMFGDVLHALLSEVSFQLAEDDAITWKAEEQTMTGRATSSYRVQDEEGSTLVDRTRDAYTVLTAMTSLERREVDVDGFTRWRFGADHVLSTVESREDVHVTSAGERQLESRSRLTLALASRGPLVAGSEPPSADLVAHVPGGTDDSTVRDRKLAGNFAPKDLAGLVAVYGASGEFPRGALARAAAFIRLDPSQCATLEKLFDRSTSARGRSMVFDVLSSAGSPEAQATMRKLLAANAAREDAGLHRMLVQRFALVERPTRESLDFIRELGRGAERRGDGDTARAALVTEGAIIGRRLVAHDEDAASDARALLARATTDLSSQSAQDRAALVKAIGNLHHPDAAEALAAHVHDGNAEVRASVASALRGMKGERSTRILFELAGDHNAHVARTAVTTHLSRPLDAAELSKLAEHVKSGGTSPDADTALAAAIAQHAATSQRDVRDVLQVLLARAPAGSEEAVRIQAILDGLAAT